MSRFQTSERKSGVFQASSHKSDSQRSQNVKGLFTAISIFAASYAFSFAIYASYQFNPFAEDDVRFILNAQGLGNPDELTDVFGSLISNRVRPVSDLVLYLIFLVAGENVAIWFGFRIAFLSITAVLAYYSVRNSFKLSLISLLVAGVYLTSRFLQYHVTQVFGIMESVNIILLLLVFISLKKHSEVMSKKYLIFAGIFFLTLYFSHERFQVVVIACIVYVFMYFDNSISRIKWSSLFLFPVALGFLLKLLMGIPQLVGTGSGSSLGFTLVSGLTHSIQGLGQILGVNLGPHYLVGVPFESSPEWLQALSLFVLIIGLILLFSLVVSIDRKRPNRAEYSFAVFQFLLFVSVFMAGMVTIRLEQRWLVAPFLVLIVVAAQNIKRKLNLSSVLSILFLSGNLILSSYYLPNSSQLFFNGWQAGAASTISQVESAWEYSSRTNQPLIIVDAGNFAGLSEYIENLMTANTPFDGEVLGFPTLEEVGGTFSLEGLVILQLEEGTGRFLVVSSPADFVG